MVSVRRALVLLLFMATFVGCARRKWRRFSSSKVEHDAELEAIYNDTMAVERGAMYGKQGKVCYDELGCFDSENGVFKYLHRLPLSPNEVDTKFVLFTSDHNGPGVEFTYRDVSPAVPLLNKFSVLMFVLHGFNSWYNASWMIQLKDTALDSNRAVILVNWHNGCRFPDYTGASVNTELVGREVAVVLWKLMKALPRIITSNVVHFVGHSLGAHVGRFFADYFGDLSGGQSIHRLTALDPAGPLFENFHVYVNKSSANFVDVLHTAAGNESSDIALGHVGMHSSVGHLDIFANGGTYQPGCSAIQHYEWLGTHIGDLRSVKCAHQRSHEYFVSAAALADPKRNNGTKCVFESYSCKGGKAEYNEGKCQRVGERNAIALDGSDLLPGRGTQFVDTTGSPPYCKPLPKRRLNKSGNNNRRSRRSNNRRRRRRRT